MNPAANQVPPESVLSSTGVVWVTWLVLLPLLAAGVVWAYSRHSASRHWPAAAKDLAACVGVLSGIAAALLLAFVPARGWPLTADYWWTATQFQFRLRLDRFNCVFLVLLSWQFAILALTGRAAAQTVSADDAARLHAREAMALLLAFGCCIGALMAADVVTFMIFWQALALPVVALLMFGFQDSKEASRPVAGFVAAHTLGSMAIMACFAFAWAQTRTTDPFAAGMSLFLRAVGPLRVNAVLLLLGFCCTIGAACALAARTRFVALAPLLMTAGACLAMRYLHLFFWGYVLEPVGVVMLWACAVAACALVGTALALRTGPAVVALLMCAGGAYLLFAVAGSLVGTGGAAAGMAYLVGLGVGLPLLAFTGVLSRRPSATLTGRDVRRSRLETGRASTWAALLGFVAVLSVAGVPGLPAFGGLALLVRALSRAQLAPMVVMLASLVGFLVCGVQVVRRGRWPALNEVGWSRGLVAAVVACMLVAGLLAWLWAPAMGYAAEHIKGVGRLG